MTSMRDETTITRQSYKSISTRLSSLINKKTGHIIEHRIELVDAHRQYGPGDTVSGKVILNVAKFLGVTHIVVCLYGYVQVFKHGSKPQAGPRNRGNRILSGKRGRRWVSEYYGDGYASLFEEEIVLCGEGRLDAKPYHFQFSVDFPSTMSLPTSIDVGYTTRILCWMAESNIHTANTVRKRHNLLRHFINNNATHQYCVDNELRHESCLPRKHRRGIILHSNNSSSHLGPYSPCVRTQSAGKDAEGDPCDVQETILHISHI